MKEENYVQWKEWMKKKTKNEFNEVGGIKERNEWKVDARTRRKIKAKKEKSSAEIQK